MFRKKILKLEDIKKFTQYIADNSNIYYNNLNRDEFNFETDHYWLVLEKYDSLNKMMTSPTVVLKFMQKSAMGYTVKSLDKVEVDHVNRHFIV